MTWRCQRLCVLSFAIFAFTGADGYVVRTKDTAQAGLVYSEDWVPLPPSEDTTTETKPSGNPSGSSAPRPQLLGSSNGIVASQNAVRLQDSLDSLQSAPSAQGLSGPYTPTSQQQDIFWTGPSSGSQAIALPSQPQRSPEPLVYASQARPLSSSQPQLLGGSLTSPSQGAPLQQLRARLLTGQGASVTLNNVRPVSDLAQQSGSPYMSMPSQASSTGPTYSSFQPGFQSALSQFPSAPTGQYRAPSSTLRPGSDFAQQSSSQSGFQPVSTGQTASSFQTGFPSAPSQFPVPSSGQYMAPSQGAPSSSLRPASDFAQQSGNPFLSTPSQPVSTAQTASSFQTGFPSAPSQFPSALTGQYTAPSQGAPSSSLRPASDFAQQSGSPSLSESSQALSTGPTSSRFQTGFQSVLSQFPSAPSSQYGAPQGATIAFGVQRPASDFAQQPSQYVGTSQTTSSFLPGFQTAPSQFPSASIGQYTAPSQGAPSSSLRPASDFAQQSGSPFLSTPSEVASTRQTSSVFQTGFPDAVSQFPSTSSGQYGAPQGAGIASISPRPASDFAQQPSQALSTRQTSSSFQTGFQSASSQVPSAPSGQYGASQDYGIVFSSLRPSSDFALQSGSPFLSAPSQTTGTGQTSSSFQPGFQSAFTQLPSALYMPSLASPDLYNQGSQTTGAYRWPQGGSGSSPQSQGTQEQPSFSQDGSRSLAQVTSSGSSALGSTGFYSGSASPSSTGIDPPYRPLPKRFCPR